MSSVERHNQTILVHLTSGDLVEFSRGLYSHWAVYISDGMIAHLAGDDNDGIDGNIKPEHVFTISGKTFNKAKVCLDTFLEIAAGSKTKINNKKDKKLKTFDRDTIVKNALDRVGEVGYSLLHRNCEHFAKWCRYGVEKSDQVDNLMTGVAVGTASAIAIGAFATVAMFWKRDGEVGEKKRSRRNNPRSSRRFAGNARPN